MSKKALKNWVPTCFLEDSPDRVDHPSHYNLHPSGIECIEVVEHFAFNIGNAIKYLWRAGLKPGSPKLQDLKKAVWYCNREIERIEKSQGPLK